MVKVRLPDHQGEDNTQTHHWQRPWQLTEYNKFQTASGFERTLQAMLHKDTIIVCHSNMRGQIPTSRWPQGHFLSRRDHRGNLPSPVTSIGAPSHPVTRIEALSHPHLHCRAGGGRRRKKNTYIHESLFSELWRRMKYKLSFPSRGSRWSAGKLRRWIPWTPVS